MIRIDEIYNNTFLPLIQPRPHTGLHWFDPFGSVEFDDMCNVPPIDDTQSAVRYLFWDQEPLHLDLVDKTLGRFVKMFPQGKRYLVTSEFQSENVARACDTYGFDSLYYFFHGWAALDWYRGYDRSFLCQPFSQRTPTKTFLCPNNVVGGRRHHRLLLLDELVDRELVNNNLISFPARCPYENKSVADLCVEHSVLLGHVDLPLIIDHQQDHHRNSHRIDLWPAAQDTLLQVVTETVYLGQRQHLTEKTFKPIAMQQPFVIVSCRGSLEYLRRYGFKTFGDFWDESYDDSDDDVRVMKIGKLLSGLNSLSDGEKTHLHKHLIPVVEHNYHHFYSGAFETLLWQELQPLIEIMR